MEVLVEHPDDVLKYNKNHLCDALKPQRVLRKIAIV